MEPEYPGLLASCVMVFVVKVFVARFGMLALEAITGWEGYYCWPVVKCLTYLLIVHYCFVLEPGVGVARYFALQRLPWRAAVRVPLCYFGAMLLFFGARAMFLQALALGGIPADALSSPYVDPGEPQWLDIMSGVIIAPVVEELLMRGVVLQGLLQRYTVLPAVLLSAVIFGLLHGNTHQAISGFITGCVLGWVFVRTRSLWVTILMHASHNAFVGLFAALPLGADTTSTGPSRFPVIPFSRDGWLGDMVLVGSVLLAFIAVGWVLFYFSFRELRRQLAMTSLANGAVPVLPLAEFKARRAARSSDSG